MPFKDACPPRYALGELVGDLAGVPVSHDAAVQHDPRAVGDAEDLVRELLDDQDRQSGGGDPADVVVELARR